LYGSDGVRQGFPRRARRSAALTRAMTLPAIGTYRSVAQLPSGKQTRIDQVVACRRDHDPLRNPDDRDSAIRSAFQER
jgi:hypothetical protein